MHREGHVLSFKISNEVTKSTWAITLEDGNEMVKLCVMEGSYVSLDMYICLLHPTTTVYNLLLGRGILYTSIVSGNHQLDDLFLQCSKESI